MTSNSPVRIELDYDANAAYIALSDNDVERTVQLTSEVLVDLDVTHVVVGIEVLSLVAEIPFDRLVHECHVHSDVIELIKAIRPNVHTFVLQTRSQGAGAKAAGTLTETRELAGI